MTVDVLGAEKILADFAGKFLPSKVGVKLKSPQLATLLAHTKSTANKCRVKLRTLLLMVVSAINRALFCAKVSIKSR
jgi:hypothetical protein